MATYIWCAKHWAMMKGLEHRAQWAELQMRRNFVMHPTHGPKVGARWDRKPSAPTTTVKLPDGRVRRVRAPQKRPAVIPNGKYCRNEVEAMQAQLEADGQPLCCVLGDAVVKQVAAGARLPDHPNPYRKP